MWSARRPRNGATPGWTRSCTSRSPSRRSRARSRRCCRTCAGKPRRAHLLLPCRHRFISRTMTPRSTPPSWISCASCEANGKVGFARRVLGLYAEHAPEAIAQIRERRAGGRCRRVRARRACAEVDELQCRSAADGGARGGDRRPGQAAGARSRRQDAGRASIPLSRARSTRSAASPSCPAWAWRRQRRRPRPRRRPPRKRSSRRLRARSNATN